MAFRAPTHHAPQRIYTNAESSRDAQFAAASPSSQPRIDDSQEWILFSPAQPSVGETLLSHTTSTDRTNQTAGRSRLSDFGSLGTEVRSWEAGIEDVHEDTIHEDEDEELDSLDSHLLEFRSQESSGRYHGQREHEHIGHGLLSAHLEIQDMEAVSQSILPAHDGLGSFQLGRRAASDGLASPHDERQFQFPSQQHPRRIKRRRESLDLILLREQTEREHEEAREREKRTRIEDWRMEQSRAIMEEVQKESRRQRQRLAGKRTDSLREYHEGEMASMGGVLGDVFDDVAAGQPVASLHVDGVEQREEGGSESFWARITRRVIQDLMGIDDRLLSILFGESLPEDFEEEMNTSTPARPLDGHAADSGWETRLMERISRELGLLVSQISDHPGAFTTYLKVQQAPLPYAGLPIIPEAAVDTKEEPSVASSVETAATQNSNIFFPTIQTAASRPEPAVVDPISSSRHYFDSEMDYTPTSPAAAAAAAAPQTTQNLAGSQATSGYHLPSYSVHTLDPSPTPTARASSSPPTAQEFTKEEWEKQLDISLVFRYLRSRFSSRKAATHPTLTRHHSTPAEAAARAARVRLQHPLVGGRPGGERRGGYKVVVPAPAVGAQRRRSSSCASQSTKVSAGQRSRRLSGSSRCYWDLGCGGSLGSGSLVVSAGMGGWGDV